MENSRHRRHNFSFIALSIMLTLTQFWNMKRDKTTKETQDSVVMRSICIAKSEML